MMREMKTERLSRFARYVRAAALFVSLGTVAVPSGPRTPPRGPEGG